MVEFKFSQHDMYNFDIKIVREERSVDGKKIVTKYKEAVFKNKELKSQRIERFANKNVPKCLRNIEYFVAPVPYEKYGLGEKYEAYGWNSVSALLAFKKEFIDGFLHLRGGLFHPAWELRAKGFIIVDPIKRQEIRKYFEKEFEDFLKNCNEEDFKYAISSGLWSHERIGTDSEWTIDKWYQKIMNDYDNHGLNKEKWAQSLTKEEAAMRLAKKLYYKPDIINIWGQRTAKPLTFESREDAEKFGNEYISWKCSDLEEENEKSFDIIVVNDVFNDWVKGWVQNKIQELNKE